MNHPERAVDFALHYGSILLLRNVIAPVAWAAIEQETNGILKLQAEQNGD